MKIIIWRRRIGENLCRGFGQPTVDYVRVCSFFSSSDISKYLNSLIFSHSHLMWCFEGPVIITSKSRTTHMPNTHHKHSRRKINSTRVRESLKFDFLIQCCRCCWLYNWSLKWRLFRCEIIFEITSRLTVARRNHNAAVFLCVMRGDELSSQSTRLLLHIANQLFSIEQRKSNIESEQHVQLKGPMQSRYL